MDKVGHLYSLCLNSEAYRKLWDDLANNPPQKLEKPSKVFRQKLPCIFRGETPLKTDTGRTLTRDCHG